MSMYTGGGECGLADSLKLPAIGICTSLPEIVTSHHPHFSSSRSTHSASSAQIGGEGRLSDFSVEYASAQKSCMQCRLRCPHKMSIFNFGEAPLVLRRVWWRTQDDLQMFR
jgi:hypothetical protein